MFVKPRVGYQTGNPSLAGPGEYDTQTRDAFYASTHLQTIEYEISRQIVAVLTGQAQGNLHGNPMLRLQSRHQLFPQVLVLVREYVAKRVDFRGVDPRELGPERYAKRVVERLVAAIRPDDSRGESPLLPILNRYKPIGTTADVDFKTTRICHGTAQSHINLVPTDTATWESSAAFRLEQASQSGDVLFYTRNDQLGFTVPYEFMGVSYHYEPDFLVRLGNGKTLVLEIKGYETEQDRAKHQAAQRWKAAVNNWGDLGQWDFHVNRDPQMLTSELRAINRQ